LSDLKTSPENWNKSSSHTRTHKIRCIYAVLDTVFCTQLTVLHRGLQLMRVKMKNFSFISLCEWMYQYTRLRESYLKSEDKTPYKSHNKTKWK
jgi:hypothetical protein